MANEQLTTEEFNAAFLSGDVNIFGEENTPEQKAQQIASLMVECPIAKGAREAVEAAEKINRVNRWLENNASQGARAMVNKFGLAFSHEKDLGNGACVVGFYTDETLRFKITEIHDASNNWFRG